VLTIVVLLVSASGALLFEGARTDPAPTVRTALARIVRADVIERQQVTGTLGFRGNFAVFAGASAGVITWLPGPGAVIRRGQRLYELDGRPVPLFYGARPAFREFALGMSDGVDVRELKRNLLALGFANDTPLDDHFDLATRDAVKELQRALGLHPTGRIAFGSVVFLPRPIRVSGPASGVAVGATVQAGALILSATATARAVLVQLDPGSVAQLKIGDRTIVTTPNGTTTPGRVASIARVATAPSADAQGSGQGAAVPTVAVTVTLLHASAAGLDQAPVQVGITTQQARNVLAAPISALLAEPGGGYAVQVATGRTTTRLVPVSTGLFDDVAGRVEISGRGLVPGLRVVVPAG
jgi:peptidoglycan hydrolase-like protein with peptidoglycan-binding domain